MYKSYIMSKIEFLITKKNGRILSLSIPYDFYENNLDDREKKIIKDTVMLITENVQNEDISEIKLPNKKIKSIKKDKIKTENPDFEDEDSEFFYLLEGDVEKHIPYIDMFAKKIFPNLDLSSLKLGHLSKCIIVNGDAESRCISFDKLFTILSRAYINKNTYIDNPEKTENLIKQLADVGSDSEITPYRNCLSEEKENSYLNSIVSKISFALSNILEEYEGLEKEELESNLNTFFRYMLIDHRMRMRGSIFNTFIVKTIENFGNVGDKLSFVGEVVASTLEDVEEIEQKIDKWEVGDDVFPYKSVNYGNLISNITSNFNFGSIMNMFSGMNNMGSVSSDKDDDISYVMVDKDNYNPDNISCSSHDECEEYNSEDELLDKIRKKHVSD